MRHTPQNSFSKQVLLNERTSTIFGGEKFRYGFNGMEADDELKGDGSSYTTEFRQYDSRLGRWLSLDPLAVKFPDISPYNSNNNNPIFYEDRNGDYPVALHYIITYKAMIKLGYSEEISSKVAHYSSVYADHPDWNLYFGQMYDLNIKIMIGNGVDPKGMEYDSKIDYSKMEYSQSDNLISSVSIHAMRTYWENISPRQAMKRALFGGKFKTDAGNQIVIEGAYNVIERLSVLPIEKLTEDQLKELGVAFHTIQDAQVHRGARWVDKHSDEAAEKGYKDGHPNIGCTEGNNSKRAVRKTFKFLGKFEIETKSTSKNKKIERDKF